MPTFAEAINWLVGIGGFLSWLLFVPQIRLLTREKISTSISLWLIWGSWVLQGLILIQAILQGNRPIIIAMGRPYRLMVRTVPSHGTNRGSNPRRVTTNFLRRLSPSRGASFFL
jgi:uncharacterized protein with PQ loop repeat